MDAIKKILGIVWLALAAVVAYLGLTVLGIPKITSGKQEDLVFGSIIVFILMFFLIFINKMFSGKKTHDYRLTTHD